MENLGAHSKIYGHMPLGLWKSRTLHIFRTFTPLQVGKSLGTYKSKRDLAGWEGWDSTNNPVTFVSKMTSQASISRFSFLDAGHVYYWETCRGGWESKIKAS